MLPVKTSKGPPQLVDREALIKENLKKMQINVLELPP